jgi:enoyl-CoA hydratase/carnithine racemase
MTCEGATITFEEAAGAGLFDATAETSGDLIEAALGWVETARATGGGIVVGGGSPRRDGEPMRWIGRAALKARAMAAYTQVRDDLPMTPETDAVFEAIEAGLERGWKGALSVEQAHLTRLRSTPEGKKGIETFFNKSAARA